MTKLSSNIQTYSESRTLDRLVAEVVSRLEAGESVDALQIAADYPHLVEPLEQLLPTLTAMADLGHSIADAHHRHTEEGGHASSNPSTPTVGMLGDFRILREIGRGGMGVVYEAEQISIGRRVALKVLPFAAMLDKQQLNRFKNEARAAGTLDHPNIVSVFSVGTERGVHYYAMQLVEGQSLAEIIAETREKKGDWMQDAGGRGQLAASGSRERSDTSPPSPILSPLSTPNPFLLFPPCPTSTRKITSVA